MHHATDKPKSVGGWTGSKNHINKNLRYVESSQRFTEIKQVSAHSIKFCRGTNGDQCLKHFCSKGRTSLHSQKSEKSLHMG